MGSRVRRALTWLSEPEPKWTEAGIHWRSDLAGWYKESNTEQGKKGLHVARCRVSEPSGERDETGNRITVEMVNCF